MKINSGNITKGMKIDYFVGYNMSDDGIGKAIIKKVSDYEILLTIYGDYTEETFICSKDDFNRNMRYLEYVKSSINKEG